MLNDIINDAQDETIKNLDEANKILDKMLPEEHQCEFCDSMETIKYPAENTSHVYLCEDCHSRSKD